MTCPIANCPNTVRWHNTLCAAHARQVPKSLYYAVHRTAATLQASKMPMMVLASARKYRQCLRDAVAAVSPKETA